MTTHKTKIQKMVKRSQAAYLLGLCPRTLVRYEKLGRLKPIKLNSRLVVYHEADVAALLT
jgi:hypothetical protein